MAANGKVRSGAKPGAKRGRAKPIGSGGSRKGKPNKLTKDLKEMILGALDGAGGLTYLQDQATKNPAAFMTLVGKVLPLTVQGSGEDGAIVVSWQK